MMNIIIPRIIMANQKYSSSWRQLYELFGAWMMVTNTIMNNIRDFRIVRILNAIASSSTYSSLDSIVLKFRKAAAKSHKGHRAKYTINP